VVRDLADRRHPAAFNAWFARATLGMSTRRRALSGVCGAFCGDEDERV
jgi:hypothetical protein